MLHLEELIRTRQLCVLSDLNTSWNFDKTHKLRNTAQTVVQSSPNQVNQIDQVIQPPTQHHQNHAAIHTESECPNRICRRTGHTDTNWKRKEVCGICTRRGHCNLRRVCSHYKELNRTADTCWLKLVDQRENVPNCEYCSGKGNSIDNCRPRAAVVPVMATAHSTSSAEQLKRSHATISAISYMPFNPSTGYHHPLLYR